MKIRLLVLAAAAALLLAAVPCATAADYVRGRVIVGYDHGLTNGQRAAVATAAHVVGGARLPAGARLVRTRRGETVAEAIARLRQDPRVRYAVPNYIAHASGFIPNDPGIGGPSQWQALQWNFTSEFGVDAPDAWAQAIAAGAPGGRGVTVAVLDTGVAYENHGRFRRDPDLYSARFVAPYDFVDHDRHPDDENGHGTHVTGTINEATGNPIGLTGLAYGARIMPVRVLDRSGDGDSVAISQGVRYAVRHGAQIINLSFEFDSGTSTRDVPDLLTALRDAKRAGVLVVAASGNEGGSALAYPARAKSVLSVGASTEHGCAAEYSNAGGSLDLVAPGGGPDANLPDPQCDPGSDDGRNVVQMTFTRSVRTFGLPGDYTGTSMATPHVSATAALVIASGVLGAK